MFAFAFALPAFVEPAAPLFEFAAVAAGVVAGAPAVLAEFAALALPAAFELSAEEHPAAGKPSGGVLPRPDVRPGLPAICYCSNKALAFLPVTDIISAPLWPRHV